MYVCLRENSLYTYVQNLYAKIICSVNETLKRYRKEKCIKVMPVSWHVGARLQWLCLDYIRRDIRKVGKCTFCRFYSMGANWKSGLTLTLLVRLSCESFLRLDMRMNYGWIKGRQPSFLRHNVHAWNIFQRFQKRKNINFFLNYFAFRRLFWQISREFVVIWE